MDWTDEQKACITARGGNVLVSAAAGSGKTAVLVERIFQRMVDAGEPVDVDRFLVVTFTRAAAAQMKEKLQARIEKALEEDPDNTHLQRQAGLAGCAHISTVHSFCGYVIQNYFHRIGLDPSYRQGTEGELTLLKKETVERILEEEYERAEPDFVALAGMNMFQRSDDALVQMILDLYEKAMSEPFPSEWFDRMEAFFDIRTCEEWEESELVVSWMAECRVILQDISHMAARWQKRCLEPDGPWYYEERLAQIQEICARLLQADTYEKCREILQNMTFSRMSSKKDEAVSQEKKQEVADGRKMCKETLEELRDTYFSQTVEEHLQDLRDTEREVAPLLRLARRFMNEYTDSKREKNLVDFNDLEQLALSILLEKKETEGYVPSEAARELAEQFVEIMIDEYQDSNRVQDTLLKSVSRENLPGYAPNIFMVGDVKQSIYRFRKACPELFAEKLFSYEDREGAPYRRIDLHRNFRSRDTVLWGTNAVFERIMHRDLGGVEYDEDARLQPGRHFAEPEEISSAAPVIGGKIETCILPGDGTPEQEGRLIAAKIQEMIFSASPLYVESGEGYRKVRYSDIVILLRSVRTKGQAYFDALAEAGIPVVMDHNQGFFETREIQLVTAMLQTIDNPRQDKPLAAVLAGPMFDFTAEELAELRQSDRSVCLYDSLLSCDGSGTVKEKSQRFLLLLEKLRRKMSYAAVAELLQDIYDETGIYEAAAMMREGRQRTANLDWLMELAREFEATTYHGLSQFVRYINRREQTEEMGEVSLVGEEEDVVRILTIHKSKGLEFPVCILAGLGGKLGGQNRSFLTVQESGIVAPVIDNERRTKKKTFYTEILRRRNVLDSLGEDMRVLYVAMTRAKEKLILVGSTGKIEAPSLSFLGRSRMRSFLDMVIPAALEEDAWFDVQMAEPEELLEQAEADILREEMESHALYNFDTSIVYDKEIRDKLEEFREFAVEETPLPVKVSVSELKVRSMEEMNLEDFTIFDSGEEEEMPVPAFVQADVSEDSARKGAAYGTIWHQVMAVIDFQVQKDEETVRRSVEELVRTGRMRQEDTAVLRYDKLAAFFASELGQKMAKAQERGVLHREQPFVTGRKARDIFPDREEDDTILVQGIIDAYFEEEDGLVLLDYKTDSLKPGEEDKLIKRYQTQMEVYREALESMTGKKVRECVLYSFALKKEIKI